jgi:hypothetical protein
VSQGKPVSKALFGPFKYVPGWPATGFSIIKAARLWVQGFVCWYNTEYHHSATRFVPPDAGHWGKDVDLIANRNSVYQAARDKHPARWSGRTRNWKPTGPVWLDPERSETLKRRMGPTTRSSRKLAAAAPWPERSTPQHDPNPRGNCLDKHRYHHVTNNSCTPERKRLADAIVIFLIVTSPRQWNTVPVRVSDNLRDISHGVL